MKRKEKKRMLAASTLSEMLVVMILTGIILMGVFDGFSLLEKLLFRIQGKLEKTMVNTESVYRLESLFSSSDSICGSIVRLEFFRQGEVRHVVELSDSLLIVFKQESILRPDTLFRKVSLPQVVKNPDNPVWIDSLFFMNDTTKLCFGSFPKQELLAESEARKIEEKYGKDAD